MIKMPNGLVEETKAIIKLYLFLRHECGLRETDRLKVRELKKLLLVLTRRQEKG